MDEVVFMRKIAIWGAGTLALNVIEDYPNDEITIIDSSPQKIGTNFCGYQVISPPENLGTRFHKIVIASAEHYAEIYDLLIHKYQTPDYKCSYAASEFLGILFHGKAPVCPKPLPPSFSARVPFVELFADYCYKHGIEGEVAEVGVNKGEFSAAINAAFPDRPLHMFDTFTGFDDRDIVQDFEKVGHYRLSKEDEVDFKSTSVELVMNRMPYPALCTCYKGYFPDTFSLYDKRFALVSLDADLYPPQKAGLEIFYPRLVKNGVIAIHDYWNISGCRLAVDEFIHKNGLSAVPLSDYNTLIITKQN
jgi:hypothetical protein